MKGLNKRLSNLERAHSDKGQDHVFLVGNIITSTRQFREALNNLTPTTGLPKEDPFFEKIDCELTERALRKIDEFEDLLSSKDSIYLAEYEDFLTKESFREMCVWRASIRQTVNRNDR